MFAADWHFNRQTEQRRDTSVGRASDWRSEGPWFNPGSRHYFHCVKVPVIIGLQTLWCMKKRIDTYIFSLFSFEKWRIRVSIPVPLECKSSALPLELIPLALNQVWKPCQCMNEIWTSRVSNNSFIRLNVEECVDVFFPLNKGLLLLQSCIHR